VVREGDQKGLIKTGILKKVFLGKLKLDLSPHKLSDDFAPFSSEAKQKGRRSNEGRLLRRRRPMSRAA